MRESHKTLLTPEYVWEELHQKKVSKLNGIISALVGVPVIMGFLPACWVWSNLTDVDTGIGFWIAALAVYAIILPLTLIFCRKADQALFNHRQATIKKEPVPPMEITEDLCVGKEEDLRDSDSIIPSYILYFEKAGKINDPIKHNLNDGLVEIGDKFYTVRIPNSKTPLRFYSASVYRLRDLTEEELLEKDRRYSEEGSGAL